LLCGGIVLAHIQLHFVSSDFGGPVNLSTSKAVQVRNKCFDYKTTIGRQMCSNVAKASHLFFLRRECKERVEDDIDELKLPGDRNVSKVSLGDGDSIATGFLTQPRDHRVCGIDSVDFNILCRQRQCDSASADA
jgi:hypothetical protein